MIPRVPHALDQARRSASRVKDRCCSTIRQTHARQTAVLESTLQLGNALNAARHVTSVMDPPQQTALHAQGPHTCHLDRVLLCVLCRFTLL